MNQQILDIIAHKPKHFSKIVRNDPVLWAWIQSHTQTSSENISEIIYSALNQESPICKNGKVKKFRGINDGYAGCGRARECQCVRDQVSESVQKTKGSLTAEQKSRSNELRRQTNLQKYGVTCAAQTKENRQRFRNWYSDPENVEKMLQRIKKTNIERYGVENCKSLPEVEQKIIATCLARYNVTNVAQIPSTKMKLRARIAEYKLNGHLIRCGYERFNKYLKEKYDFRLLTTKDQYQGFQAHQSLQFACNRCGTQIERVFYHGIGLRCEICDPRRPHWISDEEQQVFDYIQNELRVPGSQSNKSLINPYELDMVFEQHKIAIEYCGLYWHSESSSGKGQKYHYDKMKLANAAGYRLITIFSDEWNLRPDIVKSKLKNLFQKTTVRHYARKLEVKLVDYQKSRQFLDQYHLQGASVAQINLGLYTSEDQLVALMTFSNGRAALNTRNEASNFELVRFVTNGDLVVGGASKLLTHFIREYRPKQIISYADLRWSEGNVYSKIGFRLAGAPTIGYWYTNGYEKREHRFNFTKRRLVQEGADPSKTEWQIMQDLGYDRIWDCGHQKWIWTND